MNGPRRILITGATGFSGLHLCRLAREAGAQVFGLARAARFPDGVTGRGGDIADAALLEDWLRETRPDWIFHLAALVHGRAVREPADWQRVNVDGTRRLLEAVRKIVPGARVLVAGSSGVYGRAAGPIQETAPLRPESDYARSKADQENVAVDFSHVHGLHIVRVRTFNQTGPGEPAGLVGGSLARQIARIEAGRQPPAVEAVTLQTARDFCDVRDVVAGYWAALEHGAAGDVYNLCSGRSVRIGRLLELLLAASSRSDITVRETQPEPPPGAIIAQVGDASRLRACSGWAPRISLGQSLAGLLADWRERTTGHAHE